jgi:recombination protein RecA
MPSTRSTPSTRRALGVATDEILISQPDHGEQALEIVDTLARSGSVGLIVVDSVAALIPKAELEGDMGDQHLGLQARLMSQAMRKVAGMAHQTGTTVVFINQLRHKIGVTFGSPETTTGGNALKYFASVRLDIRRISTVREGEVAVANRTRVKVVKNKCSPPFTQAEFDITFGRGIDREAEVLDGRSSSARIVKSGSWFAIRRRAHRPGPRQRPGLAQRAPEGAGRIAGEGDGRPQRDRQQQPGARRSGVA